MTTSPRRTLSALCAALADQRFSGTPGETSREAAAYILRQVGRMAFPYRWGVLGLARLFALDAYRRNGRPFPDSSPAAMAAQIRAWRNSRVGVFRDFVRLAESLLAVRISERVPGPRSAAAHAGGGLPRELRSQYAVVGSGPGGALTACLLAEAGKQVLLLEEGALAPADQPPPFSTEEMEAKYRDGGLTATLGRPRINYAEGRCVGGGSEVNAGLFHRTPPQLAKDWRERFFLAEFSEEVLAPHFEALERDLSVGTAAGPDGVSGRLAAGAARLGWESRSAPRAGGDGRRQSMSRTFIPRFLAAGGRLAPGVRVGRLRRGGSGWELSGRQFAGPEVRILAEQVYAACGAVETPALLRRSGITRNIGNSLALHPTVKVVARFPEAVQSAGEGVAAWQVRQFAPAVSMGCSVSSASYLALGLLDHPEALAELPLRWSEMAAYYAMTPGDAVGTVRPLLGRGPAIVRYRLGRRELEDLGQGLRRLCRLLLEAGARELYPSIAGASPLKDLRGVAQLPEALARGAARLMTVHLFSSCPMGEDRSVCAVDSFGRVHGEKGLFLADASVLCSAPGVNPQGTIMAVARRNVLRHLKRG